MQPEGLGAPQHSHTPDALKAARALLRHRWIVLITAALVVAAAYGFSRHQQPLFSASSQVLLKNQTLATSLAGIPSAYQDPVRTAATQTQVAMSPPVAEKVVARAHIPGLTPLGFLDSASVTSSSAADTLDFAVSNTDPLTAQRLSRLHAQAYVAYRHQLDTAALLAARRQLDHRIEQLKNGPLKNSTVLAQLVNNEEQLRTMEALQTSNASVLRPAETATKIRPKTARNVVLGAVLGLLLGIGLVALRQALDTRVRDATEIGEVLHQPLLGRLPAPPKKLQRRQRLAMVVDPGGIDAEVYRMLRTNVDFVNIDRGATSIMISSALEKEGKSTTAANLAVAFARSGTKVALVDLDLRRPSIGRFFDIEASQPGVTSVVRGRSTLSQALVEVFRDFGTATTPGEPRERREGLLKVLVAGELPPDPGEFINTNALTDVLDQLAAAFDLVLIDTPPLLSVGDAGALSTRVDAMVVMTRLKILRKGTLKELARALQTCATVKFGYVVTGAELEETDSVAPYHYYGYARPRKNARDEAPR